MRLTAVVPSVEGAHHGADVVQALMPSIATCDLEIFVVYSETEGPPPPDQPGLRYVSTPTVNLFEARLLGTMEASGDVVALLEDHAIPDPMWAKALLDEWEAHPDADALIHSIAINPKASMLETAQFTLTFGPFIGVDKAPRDRNPVAGIVSFRTALLPSDAKAAGWLEYEFLADLVATDRVAMTDVPSPLHIQPAAWRHLILSFHSGRMYAASTASHGTGSRTAELRRIKRHLKLIINQTMAGRRRSNSGALGARFIAWFAVLLSTHTFGQLVGVATRSTGRSATSLH